MTIQKKKFTMYIFLNCLTLGIYGAIVVSKMGKEINALCKGDGEEPRLGYMGAVLIRAIAPFFGIITGLIVGLISNSAFSLFYSIPYVGELSQYLLNSYIGSSSVISVFSTMIVFGLVFTFIGTLTSGIYLNYWWFKQAGRLKLNAGRFGLVVKESGTDTFIARTVLNLVLLPFSILLYTFTLLLPLLIVFLCNLGSTVAAIVFAFIFALPVFIFSGDLSVGHYFSIYFVMKNLNRYADVYRKGAKPFNPMGYEYYPSDETYYGKFLPIIISDDLADVTDKILSEPAMAEPVQDININTVPIQSGSLLCTKGSCAGYKFDLSPGEEIVIGKDAKVASVIVDKAYKQVSRKHVGIMYDINRNQYRIVDYSSNGTWVNGDRLIQGRDYYYSHGAEIRLVDDKNIFCLG